MRPNRPIYLDNHATTRVDPRVVEAMLPYFDAIYANPNSVHAAGHEARDAVEAARKSIAANVGADAGEIVFTSGATESNNLAIRGIAERTWGFRSKGDGVRFYVFDGISNPAAFKREYRALLDGLPLAEPELRQVAEECQRAFRLNTDLLTALARLHPLPA